MTNQSRITAAQTALDAHRDRTRDFTSDNEEAITDLMTNLRHLCEAEDLDFTGIVRMSRTNFVEEQIG